MKRIISWKQNKEKCLDDTVERNEENVIENDQFQEEDNIHLLYSCISNQDVSDYLGTLNENDALSLSLEIVSEVLSEKKSDTTNINSKDNFEENEYEEWIKCRDLYCVILDSSSNKKIKVLDNLGIMYRIEANKN